MCMCFQIYMFFFFKYYFTYNTVLLCLNMCVYESNHPTTGRIVSFFATHKLNDFHVRVYLFPTIYGCVHVYVHLYVCPCTRLEVVQPLTRLQFIHLIRCDAQYKLPNIPMITHILLTVLRLCKFATI